MTASQHPDPPPFRPDLAAPAPPADDEDEWPLKGVRYSALTAPGPTGMRPEHLKELLGVRQRSAANRLIRALGQLHLAMASGGLGAHARWLLRTRLMWLKKKKGLAPRPVQIGEVLRSSYAKRTLRKQEAALRPTLRNMHQWGMALPGGAEALIHWRSTVEGLATSGQISPLVALDLDLCNCFGSIEWPCIRASIAKHFPATDSWTRWSHEQPAVTTLPSGEEAAFDRGTGQGDPFGTAQAVLPLGDARERATIAFDQAASQPGEGVCDEWFIDDGQAFVRPHLVEHWLKCLDQALAEMGATRVPAVGEEIKSTARLLCPMHAVTSVAGWDTPYVRRTCNVLDNNSTATALGATIGSSEAITSAAQVTVAKTRALHEAIGSIDHPATELVLTRRCADVSKLTYTLRCSGDKVAEAVLEEFDGGVRSALERALGGSIRDTSWWQATTGVRHGGLGLRESTAACLPAFLASRITARPLAIEMAQHAVEAGLLPMSSFIQAYDERTRAAYERLRDSLPAEVHEDLRIIAEDGASAAADRWQRLQEGRPMTDGPSFASQGRRPGTSLVLDAGEEDPEHPAQGGGRTGPSLQALFSALVDKCILEGLAQEMQSAEQFPDIRRIREIADPGCNHEWLWALSPQHGPTLQDDEFVEAVRLRLGAGGPEEPVPCRLCGGVLDGAGSHALCCATGEATRGHNAVRRQLHGLARSADPAAEEEPLGLIPSHPTLRPADVFTSAASPGRLSALDVGVTSPEATGAGEDCTESMRLRKLNDYGRHLASLERQNIVYQPMVWSAFGRPHVATTKGIRAMARQAARRRGLVSAQLLQRRAEASISVEIWRRAAKMVFACWPRQADMEHHADEG